MKPDLAGTLNAMRVDIERINTDAQTTWIIGAVVIIMGLPLF